MPLGYVVFKGTTEGTTDAFYATQALADAGAADVDLTAVQGAQKVGEFQPNKSYWNGTAVVDDNDGETATFAALPDEDKVKDRRAYLFSLLRLREEVGGKLAVWHASRQGDGPIGDPPEAGRGRRTVWTRASGSPPTDDGSRRTCAPRWWTRT